MGRAEQQKREDRCSESSLTVPAHKPDAAAGPPPSPPHPPRTCPGRGQGMAKGPVLSSALGLTWGKRALYLAKQGSQVREHSRGWVGGTVFPPSPTLPSSKVLPAPGKARRHTVPPPLPGQASSQTASRTSPCIKEDEEQTPKPSHSQSHAHVSLA